MAVGFPIYLQNASELFGLSFGSSSALFVNFYSSVIITWGNVRGNLVVMTTEAVYPQLPS